MVLLRDHFLFSYCCVLKHKVKSPFVADYKWGNIKYS